MQTWSPEGYAHHAGFVPALGASILERLSPAPGERILDLGCGDGTLTREIVARGAAVVGVDASSAMVSAARAKGLDARHANAEALDFRDEFDAVFSNAVLHWVPDADAVLVGVRHALKPGGRFVAEFGGHGCVGAIHTAIRAVLLRHGVDAPSPWYFPTDREYRERVEAGGLLVEDVRLFPRPTPLPTGLEGWLETFANPLLQHMAEGRAAAVGEIVDLLRPVLCDGAGQWTADYVRLQIVARRARA